MAMKAAHLVGKSISTYFEKKCEEKSPKDGLKHTHIWQQLEKMFEQLDEDTITDLNFKFISDTYNAIKAKRQI